MMLVRVPLWEGKPRLASSAGRGSREPSDRGVFPFGRVHDTDPTAGHARKRLLPSVPAVVNAKFQRTHLLPSGVGSAPVARRRPVEAGLDVACDGGGLVHADPCLGVGEHGAVVVLALALGVVDDAFNQGNVAT